MEREALARVAKELQLIKTMIEKAEQHKDKNAVRSFRYDALNSDIEGMIEGIYTHLHRPSRLPKRIEPLVLEYQ